MDLLYCSFGFLIKVVGRLPVFILGATINLTVIIVMFTWQPTVDTYIGTVVLTLLVLLYISHHHYVLLAAHC